MKTALVVGVSDYDTVTKLSNPRNDAALIGTILGQLGFQTNVKIDPNREYFHRALKDSRLQFSRSTVALFYFAGHGVQKDGVNYLIPKDAPIRDEDDIDHYSIRLDSILDAVSSADSHISIVILDACRDNPFAFVRTAGASGLSFVESRGNMVICFSTSPGRTALDGQGSNSPYTEMLSLVLKQTQLSFIQQMCETRTRVDALTRGRQMPWESVSLFSDFYLQTEVPVKHPDPYVVMAYSLRNRIFSYKPQLEVVQKHLTESTEGGEARRYSKGGNIFLLQRQLFFEMGQLLEEYYVYDDAMFLFNLASIHYAVPMTIADSKFSAAEYVLKANKIYYRATTGADQTKDLSDNN